jgi:hypothetical protein
MEIHQSVQKIVDIIIQNLQSLSGRQVQLQELRLTEILSSSSSSKLGNKFFFPYTSHLPLHYVTDFSVDNIDVLPSSPFSSSSFETLRRFISLFRRFVGIRMQNWQSLSETELQLQGARLQIPFSSSSGKFCRQSFFPDIDIHCACELFSSPMELKFFSLSKRLLKLGLLTTYYHHPARANSLSSHQQ